jgi:hypothetical protein
MTEKKGEPATREELEEQDHEELPDREVMSIVPILDATEPPITAAITPVPEKPPE